jgi:DNA-binding IclR family transcriptional regulator
MSKKTTRTNQPAYQAPAVQRAFHVLRTLADSDRPLKLSEISQRLGCSKSTTHGLVHALLRENAISKEVNGRGYFMGPAITDLAFSGWNYFRINQLAKPIINSVRDQSHETVFLGAWLGNRVLIMLTSESGEALKISATPGTTIPLFAGAVGKVFMGLKDDDLVTSLIQKQGLPHYTPRSITDPATYLSEIELVRQQGYALDDEEYLTGVRAIAVALQNNLGPPMAVWVVGMTSNINDNNIKQIVTITMEAAESLRSTIEN